MNGGGGRNSRRGGGGGGGQFNNYQGGGGGGGQFNNNPNFYNGGNMYPGGPGGGGGGGGGGNFVGNQGDQQPYGGGNRRSNNSGRGGNFSGGANQGNWGGNFPPQQQQQQQQMIPPQGQGQRNWGGGGGGNYQDGGGARRGGRGGRFGGGQGRGGNFSRGQRSGGGTVRLAPGFVFEASLDYRQESGAITALASSPEDDRLVVGTQSGMVRFLDLEGTQKLTVNLGGMVTAVAAKSTWVFAAYPSPNGFGCVRGFEMQNSRTYDLHINATTPAAHSQPVNHVAVALSATVNLLITGSQDGTVRGWSFNGQAWVFERLFGMDPAQAPPGMVMAAVKSMEFAPEVGLVVGYSSGHVKIFDVATGAEVVAFQAHQGAVVGLEILMGFLVTCGAEDGFIKVWKGANEIGAQARPEFKAPNAALCMSKVLRSNGTSTLLVGYHNGSLRAFGFPNLEDLGYLDGHARKTEIIAIDASPGLVFIGAANGQLSRYLVDSQ